MSKVLLAISERWVPDARVAAIASLVKRLGASVLVTHVVYGTEGSGAEVSPGERILTQIATQLKAAEIKVETLLMFSDDVADATVKTAAEHGVTLILLGLSTKGMLTRLIEGNVSNEVIKQTRTPVLLLPPEWTGDI